MTPDMAEIGALSSEKRNQIAVTRSALSRGHVSLARVFHGMPDCLWDTPLWTIIGWTRGISRRKLAAINEQAIRANVNLAKPFGEARRYELDWILEHVLPWSNENRAQSSRRRSA